MKRRRNNRIGRNDPCHCGSGQKYKKCHGKIQPAKPNQEQANKLIAQHEAREALRKSQQGQGKPIISTEFNGYRVVAVGNKIHYGKNRKTFIDFLSDYIKQAIGSDWGNIEISKPFVRRHQILQWYDMVCKLQAKHIKTPGEIADTPMTGAIHAYYGLAYNLYLLQHNVEIQNHLLNRLKNKRSFHGAYYETFVAAWFILAGFELSLENEQDSTTTHCEFTATKNGCSYSVEAKTRSEEKNNLDVGNQLYKALKKSANHTRIVFIDLNTSNNLSEDDLSNEIAPSIKSREKSLTIHGQPAPPAYVFISNHPYHLHLEDENINLAMLDVGFKIPDFGFGIEFASLITAYKTRQKHANVESVMESCRRYRIPVTFDGELPEFSFGETKRRFIIGEHYELDKNTYGILTTGLVIETEKKLTLYST